MLPSSHHTIRHHSHLDRESVCVFDEKGLDSEVLAEHCSLVNSSQGYSLICVEAPDKVGPGRGERRGEEGRGEEWRGEEWKGGERREGKAKGGEGREDEGKGGRHQRKERLIISMSLPPEQCHLACAYTHTYLHFTQQHIYSIINIT